MKSWSTAGVIEALAATGPFFTAEIHGAQCCRPWRPMTELLTEPGALGDRVAAVRAGLAAAGGLPPDEVELRVAASVAQLGLVARIIAVALGLTLLTGAVPELVLADLRWQPVLGGPFPLSIPTPSGAQSPSDTLSATGTIDELADQFSTTVLNGPVADLTAATAAFSVSTQTLWGNVSSALHSATRIFIATNSDCTGPARQLAARLATVPPLAGTGELNADGQFRRHNCCLIYRAAPPPGGPVCGDCVLPPSH